MNLFQQLLIFFESKESLFYKNYCSAPVKNSHGSGFLCACYCWQFKTVSKWVYCEPPSLKHYRCNTLVKGLIYPNRNSGSRRAVANYSQSSRHLYRKWAEFWLGFSVQTPHGVNDTTVVITSPTNQTSLRSCFLYL